MEGQNSNLYLCKIPSVCYFDTTLLRLLFSLFYFMFELKKIFPFFYAYISVLIHLFMSNSWRVSRN